MHWRIALIVAAACLVAADQEKPKEKSLYERLGGEKAIQAVVNDVVDRAAANPKVNVTRKGVKGAKTWEATPDNVKKLKTHFFQQVSAATGGPHKYEGKEMKPVHEGMKITNAEFDAVVEDLKTTLKKFSVPKKEQEELLKIVESTRKDIVEVK